MKHACGRSMFRVLLAGGALFVLAGGIAYATIPDSNTGVIHTCFNQALGTWRPIDTQANPPQKCKNGETQLDFNQKGPQGAPGSAGTQGPKGDKGDQGSVGAQGPQGAKGDPGASGAAGPTGPKGELGPRGPAGNDGAPGQPGPPGPATPGDAYADYGTPRLVPVYGGSNTTLAYVDLPVGNFAVTGSFQLQNENSGYPHYSFGCVLVVQDRVGLPIVIEDDVAGQYAHASGTVMLQVDPGDFPSGVRASAVCHANIDNIFANGSIVAVQVGTVHNTR